LAISDFWGAHQSLQCARSRRLVLRSSAGMAARTSKQRPSGVLHRPVSTTAAEGYRFDHRGAASFQSNHPCRWYQPAVAIIGTVHPRLGPRRHGHRTATCFSIGGDPMDRCRFGRRQSPPDPNDDRRRTDPMPIRRRGSGCPLLQRVGEPKGELARRIRRVLTSAVSGRRVTNALRAQESRHSRPPEKRDDFSPRCRE